VMILAWVMWQFLVGRGGYLGGNCSSGGEYIWVAVLSRGGVGIFGWQLGYFG
jgi:hypothetical protein